MRTFLAVLLFGAAVSIAAAQSSLPARAYYLAADVCGNEATSQFLLLNVGPNAFDFAGHPPVITSSCASGGTIKTVNAFSTNSTAMSALNTFTNNCPTRVFWDLNGAPYNGVAPAGSRIMVFTSANPDLSVYTSTTFADLCGGAPVLVVFGNYAGTDPFFNNNHPYIQGCGNYNIAEITFGTEKQTIHYNPAQLGAQDGAYVGVDANNVIRLGQATGCSCPGLSCQANINVQFSGDLFICEGEKTQIIADAGAGYTYLWNTGATTTKIDVNPGITTSYFVTVTNSAMPQCAATAKATVEVFNYPDLNLATEGDNNGPACYGQKAYLRVGFQQPSTTGFTYNWTPPNPSIVIGQDESITINEQSSGVYGFHIQYANGCNDVNQLEVSFPAQTPVKVCSNSPICTGESAAITTSAPGLTFEWSGPQNFSATGNTQEITNPVQGIYEVTVTDENGCTTTGSTAVLINNCTVGPLTVIATALPTSCGLLNGAITLNTYGGASPYIYDWEHISGTGNSGNLTGLSAGTYTVTVTDAEGATMVESVVVNGSTGFSISLSPSGTSCGNNNGTITTTITGGTSPFTFNWLDVNNTPEPQNRGGLQASSYTVTVTDAEGCTSESTTEIQSSLGANVTSSITSVSCSGGSNGSINVIVGGGSAPYIYNWADITTGTEPEDRTNLTAGTYSLTVTAANGCTATLSAAVQQPSPISSTASLTHATCGLANGTITVTVSGGTTPFAFDWSDLTGTIDPQNRTGINGGTYTVTITDANGCTNSLTRTIIQPGAPGISTTLTPVLCFGGNTGAINVSLSGGTSPYTFNWLDITSGTEPEDRTGLTAGTYSVTVTDAQGCTQSSNVAITQPPSALGVSTSFTNATCSSNDGTITLTVTGGTTPYTFNWADINIGTEPQNRTGLSSGTYTVTITDANNCTATTSTTITQPGVPTLSATTTNVSCTGLFNGAINLTPSGGTTPYSYNWVDITTGTEPEDRTGLGAGTYTVTVTTAAGCTSTGSWTITQPTILSIISSFTNTTCGLSNGTLNSSGSGGTTPYIYNWSHVSGTNDPQNLTNVAAGTYGLTVTDNNLCTSTKTFTVSGSSAVTVTVTKTNTTCGNNNGAITLAVTGGGGSSYAFDWEHIAGTSNNQNLTSLAPGVYNVTVTATATGCTSTKSVTVDASSGITATAALTHTTCLKSNGVITLTVSGSTAPYTFLWTNGQTTQNIDSLLHETNYRVTVTSAVGCTTTKTYTITNTTFPATVSGTVTNASGGNNNGSIIQTVFNGTSPYTYIWSNSATTKNIFNLAPNSYTVTVTTATGCTTTREYDVFSNSLTGPNGGTVIPETRQHEDDISLSVKDNGKNTDDAVIVYPNPASTSFVISIPESYGLCSIEIFDAFSRPIIKTAGEGQVLIKSEKWLSGVYTINIGSKKLKNKPPEQLQVIIKGY